MLLEVKGTNRESTGGNPEALPRRCMPLQGQIPCLRASVVKIAGFAFLALLASGCATGKKSLDDTVLALVNEEPVTVRHLEEDFESSHQGHTALLAGAGAVRQFLDKTVDRRLLIQEAQRIGLEKDPGIRQAVSDLVTRRGRDQLYKDEVARHEEVPEKAIQGVYGKVLYQYRVRHILTYTREDAGKALTRVRAGEAFGTVANQVSVSSTAGKGGDLGFVTWGKLDPILETEIETMKPGEVRGPIETDQGWNILLLEEKEQAEGPLPELAKLRSRIKMTLSQRAVSQRSQEYYDQLRAQGKVQIFDQVLTRENLFPGEKQGPDPEQAKQITVAKVGDRTISLVDLRGRLNPEAAQNVPWPFALKQVRGILDEAIFASLLEQEALRRGYAEKPAIAREAHKLEDALLLDRLVGTVIYPRVQVNEEEVKTFYAQNPKPFTEPEAVRMDIIALESEQDAQAVIQEVRKGGDFATIARQRSKDPGTAQVGGEVGWVGKGALEPAIEAVAFSLRAGEMGVAKTDRASFVVKVQERRPARILDFAQVHDKARDLLLTQRRREEVNRWISRLREGSEIVIKEEAVKEAVAMYEVEVKQKAAAKAPGGAATGEKSPHTE